MDGNLRKLPTDGQFMNLQSSGFLQLRGPASSGDSDKLYSELRWLQWLDIDPDLSSWTTNLRLSTLLVLQLSCNRITEDWSGWTLIMAERLKVLDLACCEYLTCTPDLSVFTKLEILVLKGCQRLEQVHPSIGNVKSLVSLDLSGCGSLNELPGELGQLEELKELILDYAGITKIPTSIGSLRKLKKLSARACQSLREIPSSIGKLKKLRRLSLESCSSLEGEIPREIGNLSSLEILQLTGTPILDLPETITNLSSLKHLSLEECHKLRSLPELPSGLKVLRISSRSPMLPQGCCPMHLETLHVSWTRSSSS
ncbi:disease resistance protein RUN1-like [Rhodamnia argentea]|uniref:Disease resistance protein RUN1-like n=1 Tax=Rhodamnia argentea TaxID=178133 RepID=A0ABM3GXX7_9MYRT|nr:disease resistance protein RUN1-like [Rhodamnia argentea]